MHSWAELHPRFSHTPSLQSQLSASRRGVARAQSLTLVHVWRHVGGAAMLPLLEVPLPDEPPAELLELVSELGTQLPFSQVSSPLQSVSAVHFVPELGPAEQPTNDWSVKTNVPRDKQNPTQRMELLVIMARAYPSTRAHVNHALVGA